MSELEIFLKDSDGDDFCMLVEENETPTKTEVAISKEVASFLEDSEGDDFCMLVGENETPAKTEIAKHSGRAQFPIMWNVSISNVCGELHYYL